MCYIAALKSIILDLMSNKMPKDKMIKYKITMSKVNDSMVLTTKMGSIYVNKYGIQDNGPINSWNTNMLDHIRSFTNNNGPSTMEYGTKNRVICFGDVPRSSNNYVYKELTLNKLEELIGKGYKYFLCTKEEHASDDILDWINKHPNTKWILMKSRQESVLPRNCISFDHRWQMIDVLNDEFPNRCIVISNPTDWTPDHRNVVICNFKNEKDWDKLVYQPGYYYWSVNPSIKHHNSLRVYGTSLIDDALWIFDYYSKYSNKPEVSNLGIYTINANNYRKYYLFEKYVMHNEEELNHYLIHVK